MKNCRPFETSHKRRRGLCFGNASAARRPRRARRQGADRETRAQRPVPVRLGTSVSKNAACAPAASTAANGTITCAIRAPTTHAAGPRPRCRLGSGAIGGAADSDSAGCRFDPCLPNQSTTAGELAERQGIAVLTRRDRKVRQVRLLHSPPSCFALRASQDFHSRYREAGCPPKPWRRRAS